MKSLDQTTICKPLLALLLNTIVFILMAGTTSAFAQQLKYTPINPSFGGNPFNGSTLLASASAQKEIKTTPLPTAPSSLDTFSSNLESRMTAGLTQYISNQLFSATNTNNATGATNIGSLSVSYVKTGSNVVVTMSDSTTGQNKTVTYPLNVFVP